MPAIVSGVNLDFDEREFCAVCGKDANGDSWFCHFYEEHRRVTLCSPHCAESYLHRSTATGTGETADEWDRADVLHVVM